MATAKTNTSSERTVTIKAPNFATATFEVRGGYKRPDGTWQPVPLVVHRFSQKVALQMKQKMETGKAASSRKNREAKLTEDLYEEARYRSSQGWDGFNASSIRNAMISACRLVGFKMTLAKLSVFVEADGVDALQPQIPLIRILGDPIKQEDMARVETGQPYITVRAAYHDWTAKISIRWDRDQFTVEDVANLLARVGSQVGIGEGRNDSKNSAGMGWGVFSVIGMAQAQ